MSTNTKSPNYRIYDRSKGNNMNKSKKTATIHINWRGYIVARDDDGNVIAHRSRDCNPAAMAQVISATEAAGYVIDWADSTVANPDESRSFDYATESESGEVQAESLRAAYRQLRETITDAQVADGATLWVEDPSTGERMTMDMDGGVL